MNKKASLGLVIGIIIGAILITGAIIYSTNSNENIDNDVSNGVDEGGQEQMPEPTDYCGDGICQSDESCSSCISDCGECKKSVGESCSRNADCEDSYCVHDICRYSSTYCGDGYCDSGESCLDCSEDCNECTGNIYLTGPSSNSIFANKGYTHMPEIRVGNDGDVAFSRVEVYLFCRDENDDLVLSEIGSPYKGVSYSLPVSYNYIGDVNHIPLFLIEEDKSDLCIGESYSLRSGSYFCDEIMLPLEDSSPPWGIETWGGFNSSATESFSLNCEISFVGRNYIKDIEHVDRDSAEFEIHFSP